MDPLQLLALAREMIEGMGAGAPRQVVLRRAVSTAYYAVFHALLWKIAATFVPQHLWKSRILFFRSLDHSRTKERCKRIGRHPLPDAEKEFFEHDGFCEELRAFANTFVLLQELRHKADYDPGMKFSKSEAQEAVARAERAVSLLDDGDANQTNQFL